METKKQWITPEVNAIEVNNAGGLGPDADNKS